MCDLIDTPRLPGDDPQAGRMPWPADWAGSRDPGDMAACRALWLAVLAHCLRDAIDDALHPDRRLTGADVAYGYVKASWIGSRDFHMVCALAGFDGVAVAEAIARARARPGALAQMADGLMSGARSRLANSRGSRFPATGRDAG